MKIGILTYQRAHNYGALLQAYALILFLRNKSYDAEIVDYWPEYHSEEYKLLSVQNIKKYSHLGRIKLLFGFLIGLYRIIKRRNGYLRFIKEKLQLPDKPLFVNASEINSSYDVIIYGSDQIWRKQKLFSKQGFDDIYFGSAIINVQKRISYAASMGEIKLDNDDLVFLKNHLKYFDAISVREIKLKEALRKIGFDSELAIDPVFFLDEYEWSKIACNKPRIQKEKYILFYQLINSSEAESVVKSLKKQLNCKVIEIKGEVAPYKFGKKYFQTASPENFLSLVKNAEFVISTSFHGVAFSLIFKKQFYSLGLRNNSERITSLLTMLGLENRYLLNSNNIKLSQSIDYSKVDSLLKKYINDSASFVLEQLNNK